MTDNVNPETTDTTPSARTAALDFVWQRNARKRASNRTFVVPTDAKGRPILSFYVSQAPRPEVEDETS